MFLWVFDEVLYPVEVKWGQIWSSGVIEPLAQNRVFPVYKVCAVC